MNGILEKIVAHKKLEVERLKNVNPLSRLLKHENMEREPLSMSDSILKGTGLIAEFKRASPSKGVIRQGASVESIVSGYEDAGASAISVLTDIHFFQAEMDDIQIARKHVDIPILRKDFIIDEYQVIQAKSMGADCILLIAAILDRSTLKHLYNKATELGLNSLVEVHNENELDKLSGKEKIIGVNNRNLDTFEVDIHTSLDLAGQLGDVVRISESGLGSDSNLKELVDAGFHGFLIGESLMKQENPGMAASDFIQKIKSLKS